MPKLLDNLRWKPLWTSHIGCLKGCLDFLNLDVSEAWLYGGTGHVFIMNIHSVVCPSGPTAWKFDIIYKLCRNLGFIVESIDAWKEHPDFKEKQEGAWINTRKTIDEGLPCYGWEFDIPEFYVVYGYDDVGYYYSGAGCDDGKGPFPWEKLGMSDIGFLAMYRVKPGQKADDRTVVREALEFAVEFAEKPENWVLPDYRSGSAAYDAWIKAIEIGDAHAWGMAYNSAVWAECRKFAVEFLEEAKARLDQVDSGLFDEAVQNYNMVAKILLEIESLFPFPPHEELKDAGNRNAAVELLKKAQQAEIKGMDAIKRILVTLE